MLYNHRLKTPLEKGLNQGKNSFFLYGEGINDYFLEGMCEGVCTISETLKRYFIEEAGCMYFVLVHTDGIFVFYYDSDKNEIKDISEEFLMPSKVEDDMPEDEEEGNSKGEVSPRQSEQPEKLQEEMLNSGINIINSINRVKEKANKNKSPDSRMAVFFEDFEWLAGLYSTNNDSTLRYIKILKDFMKIENCYVIVSLEDMDLLERYHFKTKGSNVIFIGNPSAKEVKYSYLRSFLSKTEFGDEAIQSNLLEELEEISQAITAGQRSLRESLQVFSAIVLDEGREVLNKTDFDGAVEKITAEKVTLDEVLIESNEKNKILNAVNSFIEGDDASEYRKGFILTGPPGTGKTQIVKAIANEKNCYFMAPTLSDLKGQYVGHSSGKVKRIFDEARANAPTILFIDEADTVFPMRDSGPGISDSFSLDMVNQFLQEIDGMTTGREKVFVIAATNRPDIIDAAIQSRLSERIPINLPNAENRIRIFDSKLKKYGFSLRDKFYRFEIQERTVNMSGRDIENFVKKLKEHIHNTSFHKIENLRNDEESRNIFFQILEDNEKILIEDFKRTVPVEIKRPEEISISYQDIIGYESIKNRISRQSEFICCSEHEKLQIRRLGIKVNKGVLLYGPPGNAKTMLAEATAKENNFYFIKVLSKDFTADTLKMQMDNLRVIFEQTLRLSKMCSRYQGVLVFFDEFDSLAGAGCLNQIIRGSLLDYLASGENDDRTGIRSCRSRILLMAATNYYERLDDAVIRKGRIDEHLFMDNPSEENGIEMLREKFMQDDTIEIGDDDSFIANLYQKLLEQTEQQNKNMQKPEMIRPSGADIINLYNDIKTEAFFSQREYIEISGKLLINNMLANKFIDSRFAVKASCTT